MSVSALFTVSGVVRSVAFVQSPFLVHVFSVCCLTTDFISTWNISRGPFKCIGFEFRFRRCIVHNTKTFLLIGRYKCG